MITKITTEDAMERFHSLSLAHQPFSTLPGYTSLNLKNKGFAGQWLEKLLHFSKKSLPNETIDFLDGELKTFPVQKIGEAKETMAITMVPPMIDDIVRGIPFRETKLFHKIHRMMLVPIHKPTSEVANWCFLEPFIIELEEDTFLMQCLTQEYEEIAATIRYGIANGLTFSELSLSRELLEIRTKDSTPYRPIVYDDFELSNKGRAFFFKKPCVRYFLHPERGNMTELVL